MKKISLLLLFLAFFTSICFSQNDVFNGDMYVTTQSKLNTLSKYKEITGKLLISGNRVPSDDIVDLSPLSNLKSVGGYFQIHQTKIINLKGLENLKTIGGGFDISKNSELTDATNLSQLTNVNESLGFDYNPKLLKIIINGLTKQTKIAVSSNIKLQHIELNNLTQIEESFIITSNDNLSKVLFSKLASVGIEFRVNYNSKLADCCSFNQLLNTNNNVPGTISISQNKVGCNSKENILKSCLAPEIVSNVMNCKNSKTGAKISLVSKIGQTITLKVNWDEGSTFQGGNLKITNGECQSCPRVGGISRPYGKEATYIIKQIDSNKPVIINWSDVTKRYCGNESITVPN